LRAVPTPTPPIDFSGKRRTPSGSAIVHPSGDINVTLNVSTLDTESVANVVRRKVIPVLREAAIRREFSIPMGSAGGV